MLTLMHVDVVPVQQSAHRQHPVITGRLGNLEQLCIIVLTGFDVFISDLSGISTNPLLFFALLCDRFSDCLNLIVNMLLLRANSV